MKYFAVACLICLALMAFLSAAQKKAEPVAPPLNVSEQVWTFGFVPKDGIVVHHFVLTNPQSDTVTITDIIPGCDCTHVPKDTVSIPPGGTYLLPAEFDTKTYFNETNRDIHIITDYETNPEMDLFFTSIAARTPNSIEIDPTSTAFIAGRNSQAFMVTNNVEETTNFRVLIDNDSTLNVSEPEFTITGQGQHVFEIEPKWDKFDIGPTHTCVVLEVSRNETFHVSIPIKINKF